MINTTNNCSHNMSEEINIEAFPKDVSIQRIKIESNLSIRTTIMLYMLMTLSAIVLGLFIHDRFQKFLTLPDESFYVVQLSPDFPTELRHSTSDEELFLRASMTSRVDENHVPKLAFMFLAKGKLPLAPLWEMFFKGHEGFYSIYVHTSPDYTHEPPESSVFYNRRIPSQAVQWGDKTMVDAEKRLVANALLDHSNERFILLSESCIPIFNFTTIYTYLINSNQSFLSIFDDPRITGRGRYNKSMWPHVSLSDWRKGSQWFEVHRKLAQKMVSKSIYYPVFTEHCKPPCYMDEHYFATLVNMECPEMASNRSVTRVDWSRGGSHPSMFVRRDISKELFDHMRHGFNCTYNGHFSAMCFLFARKFHPNTLEPLLKLTPYLLGHNY